MNAAPAGRPAAPQVHRSPGASAARDGLRPYYTDDPVMCDVRRVHRMLTEPADEETRQLYTVSCSGCGWSAATALDAHMVQEAFDGHMSALQDELHGQDG